MLYIPGKNPAMIQDADIFGADGIILDLEDSIAINEKDAARNLVKNALISLNFSNTEVGVRINSLDNKFGQIDLEIIVPVRPDFIRIPKINSKEDIIKLDKLLLDIETKNNLKNKSTKIIPMLETAQGVINAYEIAIASPRVIALSIGGEDLVADIGMTRTIINTELNHIRSSVVMAASAANVDALDTIYSNIDDIDGLIRETRTIKNLGFDGKSVIHPRQIKPVHKVFKPGSEEIEEAIKIIKAANKAKENNLGVSTVNGKMIDKPVIKNAENILKRANLKEETYVQNY